jgi:hypothetical protein
MFSANKGRSKIVVLLLPLSVSKRETQDVCGFFVLRFEQKRSGAIC